MTEIARQMPRHRFVRVALAFYPALAGSPDEARVGLATLASLGESWSFDPTMSWRIALATARLKRALGDLAGAHAALRPPIDGAPPLVRQDALVEAGGILAAAGDANASARGVRRSEPDRPGNEARAGGPGGERNRRHASGVAMEADELREWMKRYQDGDETAFNALYRALASRLYGFLIRMTRDRVTADDLLQEVFFHMHRARATYRPGSPVLPWAFTIARHAAVSRARSAGRRAKREEVREDLADLPAAAPEPPAEDPRVDEIRAALDELPEAQREAVLLLKVSGLSVAEVAATTGSTKGAIKLRAHRAYEAIRKRLGEKRGAK